MAAADAQHSLLRGDIQIALEVIAGTHLTDQAAKAIDYHHIGIGLQRLLESLDLEGIQHPLIAALVDISEKQRRVYAPVPGVYHIVELCLALVAHREIPQGHL